MTITVAQLRARTDEAVLAQLTDPNGTTVDEVKCGHALTDAAGTIEGFIFNLPASARPPDATLDAHQVALALYALAGNRPGVEFDSIRGRAKVALDYLKAQQDLAAKYLADQQDRAGVSLEFESETPAALMTDADLALFGKDSDAGST